MPAIQTVIDVVLVSGMVGVLFAIMAVVVSTVESTSPPKRESFSESDKILRKEAIVENDVVFCREDDIDRTEIDDTVYLSAPLYNQITVVDCDVEYPVYCDTEDISRISSYLES